MSLTFSVTPQRFARETSVSAADARIVPVTVGRRYQGRDYCGPRRRFTFCIHYWDWNWDNVHKGQLHECRAK